MCACVWIMVNLQLIGVKIDAMHGRKRGGITREVFEVLQRMSKVLVSLSCRSYNVELIL